MSATKVTSMDDANEVEANVWDLERIRADFPVLHQTVNGKPLVYLDNAASSQVPQVVIDRGSMYLEQEHSNIHRGVHYLSQKATTAYEGAPNRKTVYQCTRSQGMHFRAWHHRGYQPGDAWLRSEVHRGG